MPRADLISLISITKDGEQNEHIATALAAPPALVRYMRFRVHKGAAYIAKHNPVKTAYRNFSGFLIDRAAAA